MKTVRLETRTDGCTGELGLCLASLPYFDDAPSVDSGDGRIIAHDCLEHIAGAETIGSQHNEHKALGVTLFGRCHLGYRVTHEDLAADLSREYIDWLQQDHGYIEKAGLEEVRLSQDIFEEDLREIKRAAKESIKGELQYYDDLSDSKATRNEWLRYACRAMIVGIREARKAYIDSNQLVSTYMAIEEAISKQGYMDYEGQQFELTYDLKSRTASVEEYYEDYE